DYKAKRNLLFKKDPILSLHTDIEKKDKFLAELRKEGKDDAAINLLTQEIKKLRIKQNLLIEESLQKEFKENELPIIHEAEDMYFYLHSVLAAFNPDYYNYKIKGMAQAAYVEMVELLAPVDAKELEIEKVFEIA